MSANAANAAPPPAAPSPGAGLDLAKSSTGTVPPATGSAVPGNEARYPVGFTGRGGEYFQIWIVNVLLSVLTLGIYSAWAKVRTRRYFAGNVRLDGSAFDYHAKGLQILVGRVVAVALFALVTFGGALHWSVAAGAGALFAVLMPWAVWRSTRFNLRMTSYRNVRFDFDAPLRGMYLWLLVVPLAPLVVAGLGVAAALYAGLDGAVIGTLVAVGFVASLAVQPWAHERLASYMIGGYRYGRARFSAALSARRFYAIYAQTVGWGLLSFVGIVAALGVLGWALGLFSPESLAAMAAEDTDEPPAALTGIVLGLYPLMLVANFAIGAFFAVRVREHLLARLALDGRIGFESTQRTWSLAWLNLSNLLIRIVTGGLGTPWTHVRSARYDATRTALHAAGGLGTVVDDERAKRSALGEEVVDAFDMDFDVGF